jgi:3-oxoacyl-[acyl-carrier-protein] synthase III
MTRYAAIIGTGMHVPTEEHPNSEFKARFGDETITKYEEATGIKTRFYAPSDEAASDLAVKACRSALEDARLTPADIDLLILGTDTPDFITPATSVVVQHKLGLTNAGTFDVGCACASFPTGLGIAAGLIATQKQIRRILVVGVYVMHKLADLATDPMSFYYGDGAGAVVVAAQDQPGFISSAYAADGSYAKNWGIFAGGSAEPATVEAVQAGRAHVRFVEAFPSIVNREGWPKRVRDVAENGGFKVAEIDHIIFTQVRSKTIDQVMEDLGLPLARAHKIMDKWGYMGSACLPIAFHDARQQGKVRAGDLVVFVGSGVGYNQCAVAFRLGQDFSR